MEKEIFVFAGWKDDLPLLGSLYVDVSRGQESYAFEYDAKYLASHEELLLDPSIMSFKGRQYSEDGALFGIFSDSCPDRWGRVLMKKREAINAPKEERRPRKLTESDFLLGVHDGSRMGALRFKTSLDGDFLSNDDTLATPPWVSLRDLEAASFAIEHDKELEDERWLHTLLAPGSSLGGARPKATVKDTNGDLWIAKFPSKNDTDDMGAWEMVANSLARACNLNTPAAKLLALSNNGSTFIVKRFDRAGEKRIHMVSAMTMLGKRDNDSDASYLDIADFITTYGSNPKKDLRELWSRLVFNILIANTDDHLRNHAFLLTASGWTLSPLYDVNPTPYGTDLALMIDYSSSELSIATAIETAEYYSLSQKDAEKIVTAMALTINANWQTLAKNYHLKKSAIDKMTPAFALAGEYAINT